MVMCVSCKQKTAYEMRSIGWSSDVCSSDLEKDAAPAFQLDRDRNRKHQWRQHHQYRHSNGQIERPLHKAMMQAERASRYLESGPALEPAHLSDADFLHFGRSEEHTSELQSLMRHSYAVFCLKKKNKQVTNTK